MGSRRVLRKKLKSWLTCFKPQCHSVGRLPGKRTSSSLRRTASSKVKPEARLPAASPTVPSQHASTVSQLTSPQPASPSYGCEMGTEEREECIKEAIVYCKSFAQEVTSGTSTNSHPLDYLKPPKRMKISTRDELLHTKCEDIHKR
ncbi:hypothetical protein QQ045_010856 [Rhodiola kirilowii]